MAIILITVSSSSYSHSKHISLDWSTIGKIGIPVCLGAFLGAIVTNIISAQLLKIIFCLFAFAVAIKMWTDIKVKNVKKNTPYSLFLFVGGIIGFKSTLLGIGGGTISIPFLTWRGYGIKQSVAISATLGIPIATIGTTAAIYHGWELANLPKYSLGYIYLPAFTGVTLTSFFFTRVGAKLSHQLPQQKLKKIFAIFLLIVSIKTILSFN